MSRIGVVTFPGSLDDHDAQRAVKLAGHEPVALWHAHESLQGVDAIVVRKHYQPDDGKPDTVAMIQAGEVDLIVNTPFGPFLIFA